MFSPRPLQETLALRRDVVSGLLRNVSEAATASGSGGAPVRVRRAAFTALVRLLWRAIFSGNELGEAAIQELYDYVREAMVLVMTPNVSDLFPAVAGADLQGVRRRMAALVARIYQLLDRQIEGRMRARDEFGRGDASSKDMLDAMLDMSEQDDDGGVTMNRDVIRAFCTVCMTNIHGHSGAQLELIAVSLTFSFFCTNSRIYLSVPSTQAPMLSSGLWQNYCRIHEP